MGVTEQKPEHDLFEDQIWGICDDCGVLQLMILLPLDLLYETNHSTESVGETWNAHHKEFADFIAQSSETKILEIGASHGDLARKLLFINSEFEILIVEPSPGNFPNECRVIKDYIENQLELITDRDSVVHSHVIEHIYSPADFIKEISDKLQHGSKMFISFPNIEQLLRIGGTNSLNFEHTYFLSPEQLEFLILTNGMQLVRNYKFRDHSYFWELEKTNDSVSVEMANIYGKANLFNQMWVTLEDFVSRANEIISESDIPTYIFGAHVFTQGLMKLGLNSHVIVGVLDNAIEKQEKRLYGTNLSVFSPEVISSLGNVRVILRTTHYQEEIRNQLLELNPNVEIIE
jgi:hypothetical protein